jgi:hypothetical protein
MKIESAHLDRFVVTSQNMIDYKRKLLNMRLAFRWLHLLRSVNQENVTLSRFLSSASVCKPRANSGDGQQGHGRRGRCWRPNRPVSVAHWPVAGAHVEALLAELWKPHVRLAFRLVDAERVLKVCLARVAPEHDLSCSNRNLTRLTTRGTCRE